MSIDKGLVLFLACVLLGLVGIFYVSGVIADVMNLPAAESIEADDDLCGRYHYQTGTTRFFRGVG